MDVLAHELGIPLEAAGSEDRRLVGRLTEAHVAGCTRQRLGQAARIEALADGARIAGLVLDDRRAERLEPGDPVVEPLPDGALETLVAGRTLGAEIVPLAEAPDDAAREEHRAARAHPLLVDHGGRAERPRLRTRAQPSPPPPRPPPLPPPPRFP